MGDYHVQFWEKLGGKFPLLTYLLSKRDKDIIEDPARAVITEEEQVKKQKMKGAR